MRDLLRSLLPQKVLELYRMYKKHRTRTALQKKARTGQIVTVAVLVAQLKRAGLKAGDSILVHSSMSKLGYLSDGPRTLIDAILEVIGPEGNLLMPSSPNPALQLDYIRRHPHFDVRHDPSAMGAITEYFRLMHGVERSLSPTEPVCAYGPLAQWLTEGHRGRLTPYDRYSPFYRLTEINGKILYAGVSLAQAGTSLHLLEDAVEDFPYPVYYPETFTVHITDKEGNTHTHAIKVHNPVLSARRQCDALIPMFIKHGAMQQIQIGEGTGLMTDARRMFEVMIEQYEQKGITMYTPYGK